MRVGVTGSPRKCAACFSSRFSHSGCVRRAGRHERLAAGLSFGFELERATATRPGQRRHDEL